MIWIQEIDKVSKVLRKIKIGFGTMRMKCEMNCEKSLWDRADISCKALVR